MSITNGYCTLAELRGEMGITTATDTADDSRYELAIEAASRWIDEHTHWRFHTTSADESRYFTAEHAGHLFVPEGIVTLTTLQCDQDGDRTYEETWAATDYDLLPENTSTDGQPYTEIAISPLGRYGFPRWRKGVKLTGTFGYAATAPKAIKRACILKAQQLVMRKDMPFGVMATASTGAVYMQTPQDADILDLIARYRRTLT